MEQKKYWFWSEMGHGHWIHPDIFFVFLRPVTLQSMIYKNQILEISLTPTHYMFIYKVSQSLSLSFESNKKYRLKLPPFLHQSGWAHSTYVISRSVISLVPILCLAKTGYLDFTDAKLGLMYEKPWNSSWSRFWITSWSGGVRTGGWRVKKRSKFSASRPHCGEDERREIWDGKMIRHEQPNEEFVTNGSLKCGKKEMGKNPSKSVVIITVLIEGMCNDRKWWAHVCIA